MRWTINRVWTVSPLHLKLAIVPSQLLSCSLDNSTETFLRLQCSTHISVQTSLPYLRLICTQRCSVSIMAVSLGNTGMGCWQDQSCWTQLSAGPCWGSQSQWWFSPESKVRCCTASRTDFGLIRLDQGWLVCAGLRLLQCLWEKVLSFFQLSRKSQNESCKTKTTYS